MGYLLIAGSSLLPLIIIQRPDPRFLQFQIKVDSRIVRDRVIALSNPDAMMPNAVLFCDRISSIVVLGLPGCGGKIIPWIQVLWTVRNFYRVCFRHMVESEICDAYVVRKPVLLYIGLVTGLVYEPKAVRSALVPKSRILRGVV